ncbi:HAMP domain-containing histidine kinase [Hymenobacter sp. 15J16-1T3B]|uniref:sensor histidine kinase n=1 Tax=Hymenobacter sp. 15J16-1T3B TaxID=2886941 RepID=UPI001D101CD4|nr:HAMP domain-containing sensor histidine kinase [Hymenobacter sp. 15J16-1T3B]MCC3160013.1 HAMP domain-containing histidine kinase [Hymenobacter sp. 15J16-1T3B]
MRSSYRLRLAATVLLLAASLGAAAWLQLQGRGPWALLALLPALGAVLDLYRGHAAVHRELQDFTEAVRYRDFSRQYGRRSGRPEQQLLHQSFQEINAAFRSISREKETQYQHLQSILELIQTGIVSFEPATGAVWWLNDALKDMLRLPHLKNLSGLARRYPALAAQLAALRPGPPQVAAVTVGSGTLRLLLAASVFQAEGRQYKLVALHSVGDTLDETEADAWQKLLRVLTHEIMNSVAPIASLAETLQQRLRTADPADPELREDLELGIETIKRRSDGLLQFSTTYRSLSKISAPNRQPLPAYELLETVHHLLLPKLQERGIALDLVLPDPQLRLQADRVLLEQVLINLVLNAVDALAGRPAPRITLTATAADAGRAVLSVADNGAGMDEETQEQVFVPFFTTKKNGSGIGLSLCKQIMLLHKGGIQLRSTPGVGSVFTLTLGPG